MGDVIKFNPARKASKRNAEADSGEAEAEHYGFCCPECDCDLFTLDLDGICCFRCGEYVEMPE